MHTQAWFTDNYRGRYDSEDTVLERALKRFVDYGRYDYRKSILPFYDDVYKYLDTIQMQRDYEHRTGRTPAYGSGSYTYGNASNLINGVSRTSNNVLYSVGNLSKRF